MSQSSQLIETAQRTIRLEIEAVEQLNARIDADFVQACELILGCKGRVVVVGMGKSGHVGRKIAATLASTGTAAFFVHPAEASHGDMGMITQDDVVLALSNSGTTSEIVTLLPLIKRLGITLISMTGNPNSVLAKAAAVNLDASVAIEACPLNLAPTSSTTASLVLGDALAIALLEARGFTAEDFAFSHPGGALGRRLLTHVRDVMRQGSALPIVMAGTPVSQALEVMSAKGMGMTVVTDAQHRPLGIFTDGDLRRLIARHGDIRSLTVESGMTRSPRSINAEALAVEAAQQMDEQRLNHMLVLDTDGTLLGALHMHDLMAAKVV